MTELILLTIILTAILRTIRKLRPGALPRLANLGLRTPLRNRFFGPARVLKEAGIQPGWSVLELGPGWGSSPTRRRGKWVPTGNSLVWTCARGCSKNAA